jgi:hypothetical protein
LRKPKLSVFATANIAERVNTGAAASPKITHSQRNADRDVHPGCDPDILWS